MKDVNFVPSILTALKAGNIDGTKFDISLIQALALYPEKGLALETSALLSILGDSAFFFSSKKLLEIESGICFSKVAKLFVLIIVLKQPYSK